jgi:hypothetical protein
MDEGPDEIGADATEGPAPWAIGEELRCTRRHAGWSWPDLVKRILSYRNWNMVRCADQATGELL